MGGHASWVASKSTNSRSWKKQRTPIQHCDGLLQYGIHGHNEPAEGKAEFCTIKMERGELDMYVAKFERLARLASYNLQDQMVLDQFGSGLNPGLYTSIINNANPHTWTNWTRAAQEFQQKYLLIRSALGMTTGNPDSKSRKKLQTPEQWKAAWNNKRGNNSDAMDTTPGCTRVRRIDADERAELMKAGKCFTCKKQGHLSRDCPQRPPQRPRTNACAGTSSQIEEVNCYVTAGCSVLDVSGAEKGH